MPQRDRQDPRQIQRLINTLKATPIHGPRIEVLHRGFAIAMTIALRPIEHERGRCSHTSLELNFHHRSASIPTGGGYYYGRRIYSTRKADRQVGSMNASTIDAESIGRIRSPQTISLVCELASPLTTRAQPWTNTIYPRTTER